MPQLDIVSYLCQFSWLLEVFAVSFVIVLKFVYPMVALALKSRSKKILIDKSDLKQMESYETRGVELSELLWDKLLRLRENQAKALSVVAVKQSVEQIRKIFI